MTCTYKFQKILGYDKNVFTQYPRMTPFRNPHCDHISLATWRSRLSVAEPYCPCIRTLNISTGLAKMAFAAPAIAPDNQKHEKHRFRQLPEWGKTTGKGDLRERQLGKWWNYPFGNAVWREQQGVHSGDSNQWTCHACIKQLFYDVSIHRYEIFTFV